MSSNEPKKLILPEGASLPETDEVETPLSESGDFPFKVKYVAPVEFRLVDFVSKEGNVQGPRKLIAVLPTGEVLVVVPDIHGLPTLSLQEIQAMENWQKTLQEKAQLLGGNIIIDPATGEVKAAPMPPGMSAMLGGGMPRGPSRGH